MSLRRCPSIPFAVTRFTVHRDMEWTSSRVIQDPPQRQVGPARLKYMMKMKFNINMATRENYDFYYNIMYLFIFYSMIRKADS